MPVLAESPGDTIIYRGRSFKTYRGMGSLGAMAKGSHERYRQEPGARTSRQRQSRITRPEARTEGVEGRVPYKGPLAEFVFQLVGGLRAGMGYCGAHAIEDLRTKTRFIQVTSASVQESHPHDIVITQEAPITPALAARMKWVVALFNATAAMTRSRVGCPW